MPMLAFFCGPARRLHGVSAWAILELFMQPSMHCGMALIVVDAGLLGLGWHRPVQGAARRAMPMLAFLCGPARLVHGVDAWAILEFFMQPSMHCGQCR